MASEESDEDKLKKIEEIKAYDDKMRDDLKEIAEIPNDFKRLAAVRDSHGRFVRGTPNNYKKRITYKGAEFRNAAQDLADECLQIVVNIARHGKLEKDKLAACNLIITRAFGESRYVNRDNDDEVVIPPPIIIPSDVYQEQQEQDGD